MGQGPWRPGHPSGATALCTWPLVLLLWVSTRMPLPWSWEWPAASDSRQWLGQSTWASPGDWPGSALPGRKRALFQGRVGRWNSAQCRARRCQGRPTGSPAIRELVYCFNDPTVIHLETDLLMSGDGAGTPPREASRASSPGGAMGVWSEAGGAGGRDLASVWENHRRISCLSIPSCWGVMEGGSVGKAAGG